MGYVFSVHVISLVIVPSGAKTRDIPLYSTVQHQRWPLLTDDGSCLSCCRESKRKTAAVVSLRNGERLFGEAASSTVSQS